MGEIDCRLRQWPLDRLSAGGLHVGIEDVEVIALAHQRSSCGRAKFRSLLTSARTVSTSSPLLAMSRHWRARCSPRSSLGIKPAKALVGGLKRTVVSRRRGNFVETRSKVGEVDLYLGGLFLVLVFVFLVFFFRRCGFVGVCGFFALGYGFGVLGFFVGDLLFVLLFRRCRDEVRPAGGRANAGRV